MSDEKIVDIRSFQSKSVKRKKQASRSKSRSSKKGDNIIIFPSSDPSDCPSRPPKEQEKSSQQISGESRLPRWITAGTICTILFAVPLVGHFYLSPGMRQGRGIASPDKKQYQRYRKKVIQNSREIASLLSKGQRKIVTVGSVPAAQDVFSLEILRSSYSVKWSRHGILKRAEIMKGKKPVAVDVQKVVKKYPTLFPKHAKIVEEIGPDMWSNLWKRKSYQLYKGKVQVGSIAVSMDEKDRVRSIIVSRT